MIIDPWPTDEDMAERCGCGHTLGQHAYGSDRAECDDLHGDCGCAGFHPAGTCRPHPVERTRCHYRHAMPTSVPRGWSPL